MQKKITDLTIKDIGLPIGNILVKKLGLPEREGDSYLISAIITNYKRLPVFKNKTLKNVTKEDLIVALKLDNRLRTKQILKTLGEIN